MDTIIKKMVEETEVVVTCDKCGKEIGRGKSRFNINVKGYRCSVCERMLCYDCFKTETIKDEDLFLNFCRWCQESNKGRLGEMLEALALETAAREKRFSLQKKWSTDSLALTGLPPKHEV